MRAAGAALVGLAYCVQLMIGPALVLVSWMVLWAVPLQRSTQIKLLKSLKYTYCWCGFDLLLVCTFSARGQLDDLLMLLFDQADLCPPVPSPTPPSCATTRPQTQPSPSNSAQATSMPK